VFDGLNTTVILLPGCCSGFDSMTLLSPLHRCSVVAFYEYMCRFCAVAGADAGATNKRDRSARAASLRALEKKKRLEAAKAQKTEQSKQGVWGALSGALFGTGAGTVVGELSVLCWLRGVPNGLCSKHMNVPLLLSFC
jgi:hypothetical protein